MVQKRQKFKQKKQPKIKNLGKQVSISEFCAHLDLLGLRVVRVIADGNCFFRAIADQLEGNDEKHEKYRIMVVEYIMKNREIFEPFIEDDVPFDDYCKTMKKDGTWAGHMELQAASLVTHSNICIHRNMSPRWYIQNFSDCNTPMIHLSYHDEEHYNSVRSREDTCCGPAKPIIIKADGDISAASHNSRFSSQNSGAIKIVMAGSGCMSLKIVEEVLLQVDGNVDAAIEILVDDQSLKEYISCNDKQSRHEDNIFGAIENGIHDDVECDAHKGYYSKTNINQNRNSTQDNKNIPRNKMCTCGSKKKYKCCCGSVVGKSTTIVNQGIDSRKGKKERKQRNKVAPAKVSPLNGPDGRMPDMGALCI